MSSFVQAGINYLSGSMIFYAPLDKMNNVIMKSTTLSMSITSKLNLQLVRASKYLQQFLLDICHKPGKQNAVLDVLSHLTSCDTILPDPSESTLNDITHHVLLVELSSDFKSG